MNKYILPLLVLPVAFTVINGADAKIKNCPCGNVIGDWDDYNIDGLHKKDKSLFRIDVSNKKSKNLVANFATCKCSANCVKSKKRSSVVLTSNPPVYVDYVCSKTKSGYIWQRTEKIGKKVKNSKPMPL